MKKIWKQRYQIIDKLGQGGGGSVYKVRDMNLEKILICSFFSNAILMKRYNFSSDSAQFTGGFIRQSSF